MCWMNILFHHFGMNTFFIPLPISLYAWRKVNTYFSEEKMWYKTDYIKIIDLMAPHASSLAWKIPWMEEPGRLQSMGSLRIRHDWVTSLSLFTFMHWRRKWQRTRVLAGRIPGAGKPGGLLSMGSHRVGHDWSDLAVAAAKYKGDRESFWHRHQKGAERIPPPPSLVFSWVLYSH